MLATITFEEFITPPPFLSTQYSSSNSLNRGVEFLPSASLVPRDATRLVFVKNPPQVPTSSGAYVVQQSTPAEFGNPGPAEFRFTAGQDDVSLHAGATPADAGIASLYAFGSTVPTGDEIVSIAPLKGGIAVQGSATGFGYIMYSEESVHTRFGANLPDLPDARNSDHLIAVKYFNGRWHHDTGDSYRSFAPRQSDVLVARANFEEDRIESTGNQLGAHREHGIVVGYAHGDLTFVPNTFDGRTRLHSFEAKGSFFVKYVSVIGVGNLKSGIAAQDNATGIGYIMYSQESVHTRFGSSPPDVQNADHLIAVKYFNGQWHFDTNLAYRPFTPRQSDLLVAEVDFSRDLISSLESFAGAVHGIILGYGVGGLSFFANRFGGNDQPGEFQAFSTDGYIALNGQLLDVDSIAVGGEGLSGALKTLSVGTQDPEIKSGRVTLKRALADGSFGHRRGITMDDLTFTTIGPPSVPPDYDRNGKVDDADYPVWRGKFGSLTDLDADGNADSIVDAADYVLWRKHSSAKVNSTLHIDFGSSTDTGGGLGGIQAGYQSFDHNGADAVTRSYVSPLATDRTVEVTITGNTHWRDYAPATGHFADQNELLSDGVLRNSAGTMVLQFDDLVDGTYRIATYHHTTEFGPSERPPATPFDIVLTDSAVSGKTVASDVVMSDNTSAELSTQSFQFVVARGSSTVIEFRRPNSVGLNDHMQLNGFDLVRLASGTGSTASVAATGPDLLHRGSATEPPTSWSAGMAGLNLSIVSRSANDRVFDHVFEHWKRHNRIVEQRQLETMELLNVLSWPSAKSKYATTMSLAIRDLRFQESPSSLSALDHSFALWNSHATGFLPVV